MCICISILAPCRNFLVDKYCDMKRTRDPKTTEEVHALSAGLKAYTTQTTQVRAAHWL